MCVCTDSMSMMALAVVRVEGYERSPDSIERRAFGVSRVQRWGEQIELHLDVKLPEIDVVAQLVKNFEPQEMGEGCRVHFVIVEFATSGRGSCQVKVKAMRMGEECEARDKD